MCVGGGGHGGAPDRSLSCVCVRVCVWVHASCKRCVDNVSNINAYTDASKGKDATGAPAGTGGLINKPKLQPVSQVLRLLY